MKTVSATSVRSNFNRLINNTLSDHEPIQITDKRSPVVLLAEDNDGAIQEALYLPGLAGMRDSICTGMNESIKDCSNEIDL